MIFKKFLSMKTIYLIMMTLLMEIKKIIIDLIDRTDFNFDRKFMMIPMMQKWKLLRKSLRKNRARN